MAADGSWLSMLPATDDAAISGYTLPVSDLYAMGSTVLRGIQVL